MHLLKCIRNNWLVSQSQLATKTDMCGWHAPSNKVSDDTSKRPKSTYTIQSYRPTISHYRREHTPLRKYMDAQTAARFDGRRGPDVARTLSTQLSPDFDVAIDVCILYRVDRQPAFVFHTAACYVLSSHIKHCITSYIIEYVMSDIRTDKKLIDHVCSVFQPCVVHVRMCQLCIETLCFFASRTVLKLIRCCNEICF